MNGNQVNLGRISYINASPVYYGLDTKSPPPWLTLITDVPASLNQKILNKELEVSPISAAHYAMHHENLLLLPDLSISCNGPVLSVICASKVPLEALQGKKVILSKESATGANLLKLLFAMKQIDPIYVTGDLNTISHNTQNTDAVMVIGDKALSLPWKDHFPHVIDLGQSWFEMTGLPFVFAVWAVDKSFADNYPKTVSKVIDLLHQSRDQGYKDMENIIANGSKKIGLPLNLIRQYYQVLSCGMDPTRIKGMQLFFDSLFRYGLLPHKVTTRFFDC